MKYRSECTQNIMRIYLPSDSIASVRIHTPNGRNELGVFIDQNGNLLYLVFDAPPCKITRALHAARLHPALFNSPTLAALTLLALLNGSKTCNEALHLRLNNRPRKTPKH